MHRQLRQVKRRRKVESFHPERWGSVVLSRAMGVQSLCWATWCHDTQAGRRQAIHHVQSRGVDEPTSRQNGEPGYSLLHEAVRLQSS
jgi:hypothetical protein